MNRIKYEVEWWVWEKGHPKGEDDDHGGSDPVNDAENRSRCFPSLPMALSWLEKNADRKKDRDGRELIWWGEDGHQVNRLTQDQYGGWDSELVGNELREVVTVGEGVEK